VFLFAFVVNYFPRAKSVEGEVRDGENATDDGGKLGGQLIQSETQEINCPARRGALAARVRSLASYSIYSYAFIY